MQDYFQNSEHHIFDEDIPPESPDFRQKTVKSKFLKQSEAQSEEDLTVEQADEVVEKVLNLVFREQIAALSHETQNGFENALSDEIVTRCQENIKGDIIGNVIDVQANLM